MGVAVVRQQQFDRGVGQGRHEGPLDNLDDLGLAVGHIQRVGQTTLEFLAARLHLSLRGLLACLVDRRREVDRQLADLGIGIRLLLIVGPYQPNDDRSQKHNREAGRDEIPRNPRGDSKAQGHGRNDQRSEGDRPNESAQRANPLLPLLSFVPVGFAHHAVAFVIWHGWSPSSASLLPV